LRRGMSMSAPEAGDERGDAAGPAEAR
jgi:hypothetical protein